MLTSGHIWISNKISLKRKISYYTNQAWKTKRWIAPIMFANYKKPCLNCSKKIDCLISNTVKHVQHLKIICRNIGVICDSTPFWKWLIFPVDLFGLVYALLRIFVIVLSPTLCLKISNYRPFLWIFRIDYCNYFFEI